MLVEGMTKPRAGLIKGQLIWPDGRTEDMPSVCFGNQEILKHSVGFHRENIIVNTASLLAAQLFKGEDVPGIWSLALGEGAAGIDLFNPPAPQPTQERLESEIARKHWYRSNYVKTDGSGQPSDEVTPIVDFAYEFLEAEAVGTITEMGNFGGLNSELANQGILVNYITFPVWSKPLGAKLGIVWRFLF